MQLPPQSVIDSWPPGNFEFPSAQRGPGIAIMFGIFLPIMLGVIMARTYARICIVRDFGLDDGFILAAMLPAVAMSCTMIYSTYNLGWRVHVWDLVSRPELIMDGLKLMLVNEILFALSAGLTKISMLLFIKKIIGPTMPKLGLATNLTLSVVVLQNLIFISINTFTCRPVSDFWTLSIVPQNCFNETAHLLAAGSINIVTDFLVVLIPIPLTLNLQIPTKQKLSLILLFGSGFVVCIAGIMRTYYTYIFTSTYDRTWTAYPLLVTLVIEVFLGLITASLPGLKPLFPHFTSHVFDSLPKRKNSEPSINPTLDSGFSLLNDAKRHSEHREYREYYSSHSNDRFSYVHDLKESGGSSKRQYQDIQPRASCHARPKSHGQSEPNPLPPSRPIQAPKRPSFYTAMYGPTSSSGNIRQKDSNPLTKVGSPMEEVPSPTNVMTLYAFVDPDDQSPTTTPIPNPLNKKVDPVAYPQSPFRRSRSRDKNSLSYAQRIERGYRRPMSVWPTWNPGGDVGRNVKLTGDNEAFIRRKDSIGGSRDENVL